MPAMKPLELDALPPLPYLAHEIMLTVNADDGDIDHIGRAVDQEPGLAARVVSLANAAFFSRHRPVYSTRDAILRLGLERVRVVAASLLLAQQFRIDRCPGFRPDQYWRNAVGTAFAAGRLARNLTDPVPSDAAYLAGLLHNIGLPLLVHVFPGEMDRVFSAREREPEQSLAARVRAAVGIDQHEAGAMLLDEWGLPAAVVTTARYLERRPADGEWARLVEAVQFCAEWADLAFEQTPAAAPPSGTHRDALTQVGDLCRREWQQLEAVAALLANG